MASNNPKESVKALDSFDDTATPLEASHVLDRAVEMQLGDDISSLSIQTSNDQMMNLEADLEANTIRSSIPNDSQQPNIFMSPQLNVDLTPKIIAQPSDAKQCETGSELAQESAHLPVASAGANNDPFAEAENEDYDECGLYDMSTYTEDMFRPPPPQPPSLHIQQPSMFGESSQHQLVTSLAPGEHAAGGLFSSPQPNLFSSPHPPIFAPDGDTQEMDEVDFGPTSLKSMCANIVNRQHMV